MASLLRFRKSLCSGFPAHAALLVLLTVIIPGKSAAQWSRITSASLTGVYLYDVEFKSSSVGHAIGIAGNGTYLYRTTNGGTSWTKLKGLGLAPASFTFTDETTGVAGGLAPGCRCMAASRTTDGGATWTLDSIESAAGTVEEIPGFGINALSFADGFNGYGVGLAAILKTTDGGRSWERGNIGSTTDFVSDISSPTPETAFAIAAPDLNSASYILYRTTDGGGHWERTSDFIDSAGFQEIQFITPETGFVAGFTLESAVIYKTTDGGVHWRRTYAGRRAGENIFGLEFMNANTGYAVGTDGLILRTTDGGESWAEEEPGTPAQLINVSIADGIVTVVGSNGTVLRRAGASGIGTAEPGSDALLLAPNPVSTSAMVRYPDIGRDGYLVINDLLGREIRRIAIVPGSGSLTISRDGISSGMYIYRLIAGPRVLATGMMEIE